MRIDTHQHYWHYRAAEFPWMGADMPALRRDCLPADVAPALQATQLDAVVAVQARAVARETDFLLDLAHQHPHIVGVVGWADLGAPDLSAQLQRWGQAPAFKGLRHLLQDEVDVEHWVQSPAIHAGLRALQHLGKVYEVLVFEHQIEAVQTLCRRHDRHWLILDHLGKPRLRDPAHDARAWRAQLHTLALAPHVLCKLSGLVTETSPAQRHGPDWPDAHAPLLWDCLDVALEAFGPQRLLFGSDWPVCQLAAPLERVHAVVQAWANSRLSPSEQRALWHDNALRCYDLSLPP